VRVRIHNTTIFLAAAAVFLAACASESEAVPEISEAEITAAVPELDAVHELMHPLWHDAYPNQDFDSIRALVPEFEPLLAAVDSVELPGILRHKQEGWDNGKVVMLSSFEGLKQAMEDNDTEAMLSHTEAFHLGYEQLARMVRPLVPELESFHQELYKIMHYYGPAEDAFKIHEATADMLQKMAPLQQVALPERLADRQEQFDAAVAALGEKVDELEHSLHGSSIEEVLEAVDAVHTAYGEVEAVFQ